MSTLDNIKSILITERDKLTSALSATAEHEQTPLKQEIQELDSALDKIRNGIDLNTSDRAFVAAYIPRG